MSNPPPNYTTILQRIPNIGIYPLHHIFGVLHLQQKPNTLWMEFGVSSGSTINYIANFANGPVYGFDTFTGLPEKWRDGYDQGAFTTHGNLPPVRENVVLIKGMFQDTLNPFLESQKRKISFLHIDSDLYSSAKFILNSVRDYLDRNCIVVFDELVNYPGFDGPNGELRAFYEFLQENDVRYTWIGMNGVPFGMSGYVHENVALVIHSVNPK